MKRLADTSSSPARPSVGLVDPAVSGFGLVDRRAFPLARWIGAVAGAGYRPRVLALPDSTALAALWECAAVVNIGGSVYPERRGALVAAVIAQWMQAGGIWVEVAGAPFAFAAIKGRCEPREDVAPDLLDVVAGMGDGERLLRVTPLGRALLGTLAVPSTLLEANAGSPLPLALFPAANPLFSLVETDRGEGVLSIHRVGAGYFVRWAAAAQRPLRRFLPAALVRAVAHVLPSAPNPPGTKAAYVVLDPLLVARRGGVAAGVAIINASQVPCALPAVVIEVRDDEKTVSTTVVPGTIAAADTWVGEAIIPLRPHDPVDIVAHARGAGMTLARAVAEWPRPPGHFARDLPIPQRPSDFVEFWERGRAEVHALADESEWEPLRDGTPSDVVSTRVRFRSGDGLRIGAVFCRPAPSDARLPGVLVLPSYGCSGMVEFPARLARLGLCALAIDVRGMGARDSAFTLEGEGLLTHGLGSADRHGYRGGILDCLRGLDVLAAHPHVDHTRLAVMGASQGGGLALATGSLDARVRVAVAQVPFLCDIVRSATLVQTDPLAELTRWFTAHPHLVAEATATLAYMDVANFVADLRCPTLITYSRNDYIAPVAGLRTAISRLRCPLTLVHYREGHMAPTLLRHQRWAERWLVSMLTVPPGLRQ